MDLRHLRYFIAVAEERSFLKAAERLHISQPPLSTQIKDLETELGVTLLERSSKGILLTVAGQVFYGEARAVLARVEHARISMQRASRGEEGLLSIGFISVVDYSFMPEALKRFRNKYPAVQVQLHELTTDAQVKELAAERVDVGIGIAPVDQDLLEFHHLVSEQLVLAAPTGHPVLGCGKTRVNVQELAGEPFVMIPRAMAPGYYDVFSNFCRGRGFTPHIAQRAKQMQTVISLVAGGFGIALVPESLMNLQRTGVSYARLREKSPTIDIGLMHRRSDRNPVIQSYLAVVKETVSSPMGAN
ncbi:MAG: LysR substrate-binding domain-containing protein [Pseudomonadota bacterium]